MQTLARILVGGYDLSGVSESIQIKLGMSALDWGALDSGARYSIPDSPTHALAHNGYFTTPDAGALERTMHDALGTASTIYVTATLGLNQTVIPTYTFDMAYTDQVEIAAKAKSLLLINGNWKSQSPSVPVVRGYQLFRGALSATGAQTGIDMGAAGSAGGTAFLHVYSVTGTANNATITVQGSTAVGFSSPVTLGTFTFSGNSTTGLQALKLSLGSGTVQRYLRINVTSLGGATGFSVVAVAGVPGVTT